MAHVTPNLAPQLEQDAHDPGLIRLSGTWTLKTALAAAEVLRGVPDALTGIDATGIEQLDSAGVLQVLRVAHRADLHEDALQFRPDHQALVCTIEEVADDRPKPKRDFGVLAALERLGVSVHATGHNIKALCSFLGENLVKAARLVKEPRRFRLTATVHQMEQVGLDAVPLVALLSYLVGAVIAFLGSTILRDFGAEIYVVELVNIAFLREFGVLLTAIILAGRTASAFTAQIGAMVGREEVDAIRTLGLDPIDLLVIPRVLALLVMLPLLTFLGMVGGLLGGVLVSWSQLNLGPAFFFQRLVEDGYMPTHMMVGLIKAPVFALVVAAIGCRQGMSVAGDVESLGRRVTAAVVQAIFAIILLDAVFALIFIELKI